MSRGGPGACQHPDTFGDVKGRHIYLYIHKSKAWVYRAPSEVTRNSLNLKLRECYHRIRRQILFKNAGITFPLAKKFRISIFWPIRSQLDPIRGQNVDLEF